MGLTLTIIRWVGGGLNMRWMRYLDSSGLDHDQNRIRCRMVGMRIVRGYVDVVGLDFLRRELGQHELWWIEHHLKFYDETFDRENIQCGWGGGYL